MSDDCCFRDHMTAVAPWTCKCPCHSRKAEPEPPQPETFTPLTMTTQKAQNIFDDFAHNCRQMPGELVADLYTECSAQATEVQRLNAVLQSHRQWLEEDTTGWSRQSREEALAHLDAAMRQGKK